MREDIKIYIWGTGVGCWKALSNCKEDVEIVGFIDNNPQMHGKSFHNKEIINLQDAKAEYDYIVVAVMKYDAIMYQLEQKRLDMDKVICYFDMFQNEEKISHVFDPKGWKIDVLERRIDELERIAKARFWNMGYEIADSIKKGKYKFPIMRSNEEAVDRIVNGRCSLIRFGDGEFAIMAGIQRAPFQDYDENLAGRLMEVIQTENENILIGIADNYGDLCVYSDDVADGIREYMTDEVRAFHLSVLNPDRAYYNAYMFKCYMPYRDKDETHKRVSLIKRIWNQRDAVIVEGCKTRTGQGNDLLDNAKSVHRILCPTKNAFSYYDEILCEAKKTSKESLILCALGPAGKVLAYDLAMCGYQIVDIGQIDMDYEWYRAGKGKKAPIPTKYVSQLPPTEICDINDEAYEGQIIACIGEQI